MGDRMRAATRFVRTTFTRARFEAALALDPVRNLVDRTRHPDVVYRNLDAAGTNQLVPVARRTAVAAAIRASLADSDNLDYFRNLSWYNWCHRHLPRGVAVLDDLYPPNVAALDFLAHRFRAPEQEVLLDFPCGIGALLVYARDLGFTRIHGYDNWKYLARASAERFLERFGLDRSVLIAHDDLRSLPVTILVCIGFPLVMMMESSSIWTKTSVRYVLADRNARPASLPGFRRAIEYPGLLTVFERLA